MSERPGRIGVGVSGAGSNLRALAAATGRRGLDATVVLVFADRPCAALDWAVEQGIETALVPGGDDPTLAATLAAVDVDTVVLAGYMRIVGPAVLGAFPGRILNTHPSLLPAFPGAHAVADALAHGVKVTGCTVHIVDATLDGGPILLQEAVPVVPGDSVQTLHDRIRAVEHRLLPWAVALLYSGAVDVDGRRAAVATERAEEQVQFPRRALLAVSDKFGLVPFAERLVRAGFELVSTGGTARVLREAGLPVTDVAAVTGVAEMLDGRVKTLHPRIHAGVLADQTSHDHRAQLVAASIAPFELVVVNLYPFAAAAERPGITLPELIEEIDIGGPALIRAAAKNHRGGVAVVTSPARYDEVAASVEGRGGVEPVLAAALAVDAFRHTAAYDARIATELPGRILRDGGRLAHGTALPGSADPYPASLTIALEKVETLRYGENPHQSAARYRRPGSTAADGPFATGEPPLQ
ncbi:MAG TPA: phosphoribosylglycinamide formyltransferase, partial [Candidatus Limnocylindrales bacterium]